MAINPLGKNDSRAPQNQELVDLYTATMSSGSSALTNPQGKPPLGKMKKGTWQSFSSHVSTATGQDEDEIPSLGDNEVDGLMSSKILIAEKLRPEDLVDIKRRPGSYERDPLECRLEATVNSIFQRRKLEESRQIATDYGLSEGDSFSIQCWGDKQCDIPATCMSTFLCRWLCCCCSSCVSKTTNYERLDKYLIRKECTTSYEECIKELSLYSPEWLVKLFLYIQNPQINDSAMFSMEEILELKQEFFNVPAVPWIGLAPLLVAINVMRIATEASDIINKSTVPGSMKSPSWLSWPLYRRFQNAVEIVSQCEFLGRPMTLELVAQWLLVLPTGDEDFSRKGAMRKIYSMLCATLATNLSLVPGQELDPVMVLGVLLRILKEHKIILTPKDNLQKLAFDCTAALSFDKISIEMQRRTLALLRRALNSRYVCWWDYFNYVKKEIPLSRTVESKSISCSGCCSGCSSCCKKEENTNALEDTIDMPIVNQPKSVMGSRAPSMYSLTSKTSSLRRGGQTKLGRFAGLGYSLIGLGLTGQPLEEDPGQVSDSDED